MSLDPDTACTVEVVRPQAEHNHRLRTGGSWANSGNTKRLGGYIHETLKELVAAPYTAIWVNCTTSDLHLSDNASLFPVFFVRDRRAQVGALHPEIDGDAFQLGLNSFRANVNPSRMWRDSETSRRRTASS